MRRDQDEPQQDHDPFRDVDVSASIEEPSPHVDERIFAMARAELESRARGERRRVRWIEIGVAAAVVLVAVLLFKEGDDGPRTRDNIDSEKIVREVSESPLAAGVSVGDFASGLLEDQVLHDEDAISPGVAVTSLRADLALLTHIANAVPMENESEKNQILTRLERCVADINRLEARLGTTTPRLDRITPNEGGPR
jgi:hypothetical protein